jgi:hypothetical protein
LLTRRAIVNTSDAAREPKILGLVTMKNCQMSSLSIGLVNLADRKEYRVKADELREQWKKLLVNAGEPEPEIDDCPSP